MDAAAGMSWTLVALEINSSLAPLIARHQAPRMTHPVEAPADLAEHLQPHLPVGVRQIDVLAPVTARGDMVEAASEFES